MQQKRMNNQNASEVKISNFMTIKSGKPFPPRQKRLYFDTLTRSRYFTSQMSLVSRSSAKL